jgi:transcriptional regulator with XRE-family HTH domain
MGLATDNDLGRFLRARRDLLSPAQVGVRVVGRRRAPGLRRDEVAELAGVSEAYYVRLERGRDTSPSPQVVDALARALQLDRDARRHLCELAGVPAPLDSAPSLADAVPAGVEMVVDQWLGPAIAADDSGLVLRANRLARALSPANEPGVNGYRSLFLDPAMRPLYAEEWDRVAAEVVAGLRAVAGSRPEDPILRSLIGELAIASEAFRELWARYEVRPRSGSGLTRMQHPVVGPIVLRYEKLAATDHPRVGLVLFSAGPAKEDGAALGRLRRLAPR